MSIINTDTIKRSGELISAYDFNDNFISYSTKDESVMVFIKDGTERSITAREERQIKEEITDYINKVGYNNWYNNAMLWSILAFVVMLVVTLWK